MPEDQVATMVHGLLHGAERAKCAAGWSEMRGDDCARSCPQCGVVAFRVDLMQPEVFCSESAKFRNSDGELQAFRRKDGTYTFSNKSCLPKLLAPPDAKLDNRTIVKWWLQRWGRYNRYLSLCGLLVGGGATALVLLLSCLYRAPSPFNAGIFVLLMFASCAIASAIGANVLFLLCVMINLVIPRFLRPVRKYSGPLLLKLGMGTMGIAMALPMLLLLATLFTFRK